MAVTEIAPTIRVAPESARVSIGRLEIVFSRPVCSVDGQADCDEHSGYPFAGICDLYVDGKPVAGVESIELVVSRGDFVVLRVKSANALTVAEIPIEAGVILSPRGDHPRDIDP